VNEAWLVLAYTLPAEPSRMRVSIWRRLRKLGAVYLDEGVWVLPNSEEMAGALKIVVREIENFGGTAAAFVSSDFEGSQAGRMRARFLAARDEEYAELQGQCQRFMVHVEHATETERYTFAEIDELEEELAKLERWLGEIRSRDAFGSPQAQVCAEAIEKGRAALVHFTDRAYSVSGSRDESAEAASLDLASPD
jgi:hypothetical protein